MLRIARGPKVVGQIGWHRKGLSDDKAITQHRRYPAPILEKILLQQRNDLIAHRSMNLLRRPAIDEKGMANPVFAVDQIFDPLVDGGEDGFEVYAIHQTQKARIGSHFPENEPSPQGRVE